MTIPPEPGKIMHEDGGDSVGLNPLQHSIELVAAFLGRKALAAS
jgi:hypothetical protein